MEDNYSLAGLMMLFSLRADPLALQKISLLLERENTIFFQDWRLANQCRRIRCLQRYHKTIYPKLNGNERVKASLSL